MDQVCTCWVHKNLVVGVVHKECIRCGRTNNRNDIYIVGLVIGPDNLVVLPLADVAHGKEREPHAAGGLGTMNENETRCIYL